jgi:hypothetical protein
MSDPEFDPEPHLHIIPAGPGYRAVNEANGILSAGEDIIGWRVQTHWDQGEHISVVVPILIHSAGLNAVGTQHPDGTVSYLNRRFGSLVEAQRACVNLFGD